MKNKPPINLMYAMLFIFFSCLNFTSLFSQTQRFNLGFQSAVYFTQIEGDNLRGFNNLGYSVGWLGGYNFNANNELIFSGLYEKIGSNRNGTKTSGLEHRPLAEVDLQVVSIHLAFSKKFGDSWDGENRFRYTTGLKFNNLLKQNSKLYTGIFDYNPELIDEDFKKRYISLKLSVGLIIMKRSILDLTYEHSLQNILHSHIDSPISKLVPFYLGLSLSYYI